MTQDLNEQERQELDRRIVEAEKRTGAQIVLAVVRRSDVYPELPWKAFALGAGAAGLAVIARDLLRTGWPLPAEELVAVTVILAAGAVCALAGILWPQFARVFLDTHRAEGEARQYAESLFLSREIFATKQRRGILLFVSLFERKVIVLPDRGLAEHLPPPVLQGIIARMTGPLAAGQVRRALDDGMTGLEVALAASSSLRSGGNELPDGIVEEKGP